MARAKFSRMVFSLSAQQQDRIRTTVVLVIEIALVHSSLVLGWKYLWPYISHYLPDYQPLLNVIWSKILEPYAVSLFSAPSIVALVMILWYMAAKSCGIDVFDTEGMVDVLLVCLVPTP